MNAPPKTDRGILVFAIWAVLGFLGLGFMLEGMALNSYLVALVGVALILASFVAHIIVNAVFDQGFTPGETALGIGAFGVLAIVFISGWLVGGLSMPDFYAGLTLFGALSVGFLAYLMTRYGLRGAFSHFHRKSASLEDPK
ncbi:MAG: hypothetical protein KGN33_03755 [Paracoccaceae bacterium]|nr:hypothetical protein [Paracoccaceae bacterium]